MTQTIESSATTVIDLEQYIPARQKIFGIGFHKTSTSSLANALYKLGYAVDGYFNIAGIPAGVSVDQYVIERARQSDVVQDMPWPVFFRELDAAFPGSKFVLTVRDPERWLRSVVTHFGRKVIPSHVAIYGVQDAASHPDVYLERLRRHEEEVREYFAERPDDLLVMDIAGGDAWPELCGFLGIDEPEFPFPWQNPAGDRNRGRVRRVLTRGISRATALASRWTGGRLGARPGAIEAWGAVHTIDRHYGGLLELASALSDDGARAALLGVLVEHYRGVSDALAGATGEAAAVVPAMEALSTSSEVAEAIAACRGVRLQLRCWAADLSDEDVRSVVANGQATGDVVWRSIVNRAVRDADRATAALAAAGVTLQTRTPLTEV